MRQYKNRTMLLVTLSVFIIMAIVHIMVRQFKLLDNMSLHSMGHGVLTIETINHDFGWILNGLFIIPLILLLAAFILYRVNNIHQMIPMLNTLALTFSSISMIAGGGGRVEFHFSIFMVVAIMCYYESIKLISIMTIIFAVQHILGFFLFPEIVFGATQYDFTMLLIHAIFLILTSAAISLQISSNKSMMKQVKLEMENNEREIVKEIVNRLLNTSDEIVKNTKDLSVGANESILTGKTIATNIEQVSSGTEVQTQKANDAVGSMEKVDKDIMQIVNATSVVSDISQATSNFADQGNEKLGYVNGEYEFTSNVNS